MNPYDVVGLVGVVTYVFPFVMVQIKKMDSNDLGYSAWNFIGSSCFLISLTNDFNLASFIANVIWTSFSLLGIYRIIRSRTRKQQLQISIDGA